MATALKHLLWHRGGWDQSNALSRTPSQVMIPKDFDPPFKWQFISAQINNPRAPNLQNMVRFVFQYVQLNDAPGTVFHYSNFGFQLLGMIIKRLSGQTYDAYIKDTLNLCGGGVCRQFWEDMERVPAARAGRPVAVWRLRHRHNGGERRSRVEGQRPPPVRSINEWNQSINWPHHYRAVQATF